MRFAEVFLRLGVALVSWLVIIAYLLWLAILPQTLCSSSETSLWAVLLYSLPAIVLFIALLNVSAAIPAIHETLRWLGLPALLLGLLASRTLITTLLASTIGGEPVCGIPQSTWSTLWAPAHTLVLALLAIQYWRGRPPGASG